jgi:RHS repeat-associated protein
MTPAGTTHYIQDLQGQLIVEATDTGTPLREYIWIDDIPLAVFADLDTASPQLYFVHPDHLNRPLRMTDGTQAVVWDAVYRPFGDVHTITGSASLNLRFPGQYFLIESGLAYNWHRHYDPTLGRYTQPDPMEFVDGPSLYSYANSAPTMHVDPEGKYLPIVVTIAGAAIGAGIGAYADYLENRGCGCPAGSSVAGITASAVAGAVLGDNLALTAYPRAVASVTGGTSITSSILSWLLPYKMGGAVWAPTFGRFRSTTNTLGRFVGRWSPFIGAGVIADDLFRIARCSI